MSLLSELYLPPLWGIGILGGCLFWARVVKGVRVVSTLNRVQVQTKRTPLLPKTAQGSSAASTSIWSPLHIPRTGLFCSTASRMILRLGLVAAIAPARR